MKKKHAVIFLIVSVAVFLLMNFGIALTSTFSQIQEAEDIEPVDISELDLTNLVAEGSLTSVGNDSENYTGEVDWYIFTSAVDTTATITLNFDFGNDYDLYLYDANGSIVLDDSIYDNPEILIYNVAASTPYLISVAGWEGSPGDYTLTISPEEAEISAEINLPEGWSMISLPVRPDSLKLSELFPDAVVVYDFTKGTGYVRVAEGEDLKVGKGYWILLNDARKYTITGRTINEYTFPVYEDRWDMIGGCTSPAQASVTNGHIAVIYGFVRGLGYQWIPESENLEPGKGYWIMYNYVMDQCELKVEATDS